MKYDEYDATCYPISQSPSAIKKLADANNTGDVNSLSKFLYYLPTAPIVLFFRGVLDIPEFLTALVSSRSRRLVFRHNELNRY